MAESNDLLKTLLPLLVQQQKSPMSDIANTLLLMEIIKERRQSSQIDTTQLLNTLILRDILKDAFGKDKKDELKEMISTLTSQKSGEDVYNRLLAIMDKSYDRTLELMKEQQKVREEHRKETEELKNMVYEILQAWDKDKMEMIKNFRQSIQELVSKGEMDKLAELIQFYEKMEDYKKRLAKLLSKERIREEPIVVEKGGERQLNVNALAQRVFDLLELYLQQKPEKKVVSPPPRRVVTPTAPAPAPRPVTTPPAPVEVVPKEPARVEVAPKEPTPEVLKETAEKVLESIHKPEVAKEVKLPSDTKVEAPVPEPEMEVEIPDVVIKELRDTLQSGK